MKKNKAQHLLADLITDSKLYQQGQQYKELLDFINQMPNIAPFNAMLLQIQKPGLRFAASKTDWQQRFKRQIKEGARPLVILWPFAPVVFIYDMEDTEGAPLPLDVAAAFRATGAMTERIMNDCAKQLFKQGIEVKRFDYGDGHAGHIQRPEHDIEIAKQSSDKNTKPDYKIRINARHDPNVQFATLIHELAHLYLGHLGPDKFLKIKPATQTLNHATREIEAESVCYLVCNRHQVKPNSECYLSGYINHSLKAEQLDLDNLLTAAGRIEAALCLIKHSSY